MRILLCRLHRAIMHSIAQIPLCPFYRALYYADSIMQIPSCEFHCVELQV